MVKNVLFKRIPWAFSEDDVVHGNFFGVFFLPISVEKQMIIIIVNGVVGVHELVNGVVLVSDSVWVDSELNTRRLSDFSFDWWLVLPVRMLMPSLIVFKQENHLI